MTVLETAGTAFDAYLQALTTGGDFGVHLTDDVTFELIGTDQVIRGRAPVVDAIVAAHREAFDSSVEIRSVCLDRDGRRAAIEVVFSGRHTGEFAGIAATGRHVRVPYSVHYDLTDHGVSAIRVYAFAQGLVSALTT